MSDAAWQNLCVRLEAQVPGCRVTPERLLPALENRGLQLDSAYATDVALAMALGAGDAAALAHFEEVMAPQLQVPLQRFGRDDDFVAECLQRLRVKLFTCDQGPARVEEYRATGTLEAWFQIILVREAQMLLRASQRVVSDEEALLRLAASDPLLRETRQALKDCLSDSLRRALSELVERDRTLLRMSLLESATTGELGRIYGVHRATAFRWLRDARETLLERTRSHFQERAGISDSEVDSLMRSLGPSLSIRW